MDSKCVPTPEDELLSLFFTALEHVVLRQLHNLGTLWQFNSCNNSSVTENITLKGYCILVT